MPLGNLQSLENTISSRPGSFGYNEATRKFELPSPSGQPDLTFFASRSTIDNGVATSPNENIYTTRNTDPDGNVTTNNSLDKMEASQTTTVNNSLGFRLNLPLAASADFHSGLSSGLDYKTYESTSYKTNIFTLSSVIVDNLTRPPQTNHYSSEVITPVPKVITKVDYLPVLLRYDVGWRDFLGTATLGLGLNVNLWYDATVTTGDGTNSIQISGQKALQYSTGSTESSGHWVILNPSFSHQFQPFTNWITTIRADGQWASEPLISNEQFGAGGVNSVRGYQEGEVFGDTGWHVSLEQQTPPHVIGMVHGNLPLTVRGSVYMDYARVYLLDSTRGQSTKEDDLWGTGFGTVASVGSQWEARMLFSLPLLQTVYTSPYRPFFNFSLTAQF
jgi:outer membrane protein assembly factor BamA